jgi:hypothetical protein
MRELLKETTILAPAIVVKKARQLKEAGLFNQALKLLEENKVEFDIYSNSNYNEGFIQARIGSRRVYDPSRNVPKKKKNKENHFKKTKSAPKLSRSEIGQFVKES